jgi:hypothetical protein
MTASKDTSNAKLSFALFGLMSVEHEDPWWSIAATRWQTVLLDALNTIAGGHCLLVISLLEEDL